MKSIWACARGSPSLARSYILVLAVSETVPVHTTDTGVARVNCFATGNLTDGLADLTEALDALCNGADRLFCRERVDLGLGAW